MDPILLVGPRISGIDFLLPAGITDSFFEKPNEGSSSEGTRLPSKSINSLQRKTCLYTFKAYLRRATQRATQCTVFSNSFTSKASTHSPKGPRSKILTLWGQDEKWTNKVEHLNSLWASKSKGHVFLYRGGTSSGQDSNETTPGPVHWTVPPFWPLQGSKG